jgi:iron complex transport system substrate-binding protein
MIPESVNKIFALSPALTEMVFYICPDSLIIARTQACNYPKEALGKKVISTYPMDVEAILEAGADLILSEEGITSKEQLKLLEDKNVNVYSFKYRKVEDIYSAMMKIGEFCNCEQKANLLVAQQKKDLSRLSNSKNRNLKVLGLIWTDPIYSYGKNTLFSDQLRKINLRNAVDSIFQQPYPELSREYILKINPDIIVGPSFRHLDSTFFNLYPELKRITAYQKKAVIEVDGDVLTRPGPRSIQAMEVIQNYLDNE